MRRALVATALLALAGCVPAFAGEAAPLDETATNLYIVSNVEVRRGWRKYPIFAENNRPSRTARRRSRTRRRTPCSRRLRASRP